MPMDRGPDEPKRAANDRPPPSDSPDVGDRARGRDNVPPMPELPPWPDSADQAPDTPRFSPDEVRADDLVCEEAAKLGAREPGVGLGDMRRCGDRDRKLRDFAMQVNDPERGTGICEQIMDPAMRHETSFKLVDNARDPASASRIAHRLEPWDLLPASTITSKELTFARIAVRFEDVGQRRAYVSGLLGGLQSPVAKILKAWDRW